MVRTICGLLSVTMLTLLASCASLNEFRPYHPVGKRILQQTGEVHLTVEASQTAFEFSSSITMDDVMDYVTSGLTDELGNAGLYVVSQPGDGVTEVVVDVEQFDMGYELFYWWLGLGYSSSKTLATVQLNVAVEVPGAGRRYLRRFAEYEQGDAVKFWVYFIPIPLMAAEDEPELMLSAAQKVFSQVAEGIARITLNEQGG